MQVCKEGACSAPPTTGGTAPPPSALQHDNGFDYLVADPCALRRTRYFPGLGWLLPRAVWDGQLQASFPPTHWDHWMRDSAQHRGRDVVIPEVPRDYHAGVKGTYMDVATHNTYFGSVALQADARFSWDTPEGAAAVELATQPAADARLRFILSHASTRHLSSPAEVLAFDAGVGVVWYDCPTHVINHDQMRSVAAFFGIWHEGGRGSREGVHELWWRGSAKLFLVNVYAGPPMYGMPVSGSIEVAPPDVRALRPASARVIAWQEFTAAAALRQPLPRHTALYGMRIETPLAHVAGKRAAWGGREGACATTHTRRSCRLQAATTATARQTPPPPTPRMRPLRGRHCPRSCCWLRLERRRQQAGGGPRGGTRTPTRPSWPT